MQPRGVEGRSSFFETKEAKKLVLLRNCDLVRSEPRAPNSKSFLVLFFKKELFFLPSFRNRRWAEAHPTVTQ
jgi:hypothetical protein